MMMGNDAVPGGPLTQAEISVARDLLFSINTNEQVSAFDRAVAHRLKNAVSSGLPAKLGAAHAMIVAHRARLDPALVPDTLAALDRAAAPAHAKEPPMNVATPPRALPVAMAFLPPAAAVAEPRKPPATSIKRSAAKVTKKSATEVSADRAAARAIQDAVRLLAHSDILTPAEAAYANAVLKKARTPEVDMPACRKLLRRHAAAIPSELLADALRGDPDAASVTPVPTVAPTVETPVKRGRGRPRKTGGALTQVQRNKASRERRGITSLELPRQDLLRFRALRDELGLDNVGLMKAAVRALRKEMGLPEPEEADEAA